MEQKGATKAELLKIRPEGALVRFQFVELLLRLAGQKYHGEPGTETFNYSLLKLLEENILPYYHYEQGERFRQEKMFNSDVHKVFKANE